MPFPKAQHWLSLYYKCQNKLNLVSKDSLLICLRQNFYGNILLIDEDNVVEGETYSIPDENPFKDNPELGLPEIFTYGYRNPWRCSIDGNCEINYHVMSQK